MRWMGGRASDSCGRRPGNNRCVVETIRVLLVDDDPTVLKGLRMRLLLAPDVEVIGEAVDGREAIALTSELRPDVVLLDINMPGMNGVEACSEIATGTAETRVVMLSLHDDALMRERCAAAGAAGFVGKQEAAQALLPAIREAAGHAARPPM